MQLIETTIDPEAIRAVFPKFAGEVGKEVRNMELWANGAVIVAMLVNHDGETVKARIVKADR